MKAIAARFHRLTIADLRRETADAVSIAFAVPERLRAQYRFRPGQYLTLRATLGGDDIRRCYSICSGLDDGELRVAIRAVPGGVFSTHAMTGLRIGDTLSVMTPQGQFTPALAPAAAHRYLALACGSGITPVLSIVSSVLTREPASRVILLYGNRTSASILFGERLAALKDRHLGRLALAHVLSREAQDVALLHGRLDAPRIPLLLRAVAAGGPIDAAFLCGPSAMMTEGAIALTAFGLPPERIHVEHFTPAPPLPGRPIAPARPATAPPPSTTVEIVLDGSRRRIAVPDGVSIIDAAREAGLDLPYSCRGGMCCTCRARIVAGRAAMAVNYSLQPDEIAAGFVLTCQARPLTPHLVLDYDAA